MTPASTLQIILLCFLGVNPIFSFSPLDTRYTKKKKNHVSLSATASNKSNNKEHSPYLQDMKNKRAYPQQTPHAGRHFRPSHPNQSKLSQRFNRFKRHPQRTKTKRFMEGWYYRLTIPESNVSFAFIFSIEDPFESELSLSCVQVMGPNDEYVVQAEPSHEKFWAFAHSQSFGCVFDYNADAMVKDDKIGKNEVLEVLDPDDFEKYVKAGFQMLPTRLQGKVKGHDGSLGGVLENQGIPRSCDFDVQITPLSGWGDDDQDLEKSRQKSTAGWLASYSVFEPHWQVTLADARATGYATWNGTRYDFENVPFYAEKNWGGSFPCKWYWVQCNSFQGFTSPDGSNRLSLTAGGGIRKVPFGGTEDLGMVCIHYNGVFYEAVPWTGDMEWEVDPWGSWKFSAKCTSGKRLFEVDVVATCEEDGVVLRAPTQDLGMVYFCRDSFFANVELSLYELIWDKDKKEYVRGNAILENVKSIERTGAVEIGGGPYWNPWKGKSKMKSFLKSLVKLPYLFGK
ncbi:tocopherol cyclase [Chaetoceros tenuissimus]|uniref:Tocopherol cyclase n=1 Tax=Chaetoceros tenuissimus TaxID=426638 RepID=A0AAD3DB79_9STRA|nr:tocopherol cyclase [Chaetoceros tenuissimus]